MTQLTTPKIDHYEKVDMSYKDHPLKIAYDIESEPDLFTLAMIHDKAFTLMFFGNEQFDDVTEEYLRDQTRQFVEKEGTMRDLNISSADEVDINILKYTMGNKLDIKRLNNDLQSMIICKPLNCDKKHISKSNSDSFVEYYGWNSANYDLFMIIAVYLLAQSKKEKLTPRMIRDISNLIISYHGTPYKLGTYLEEETAGVINAQRFNYTKNLALWSDGHIDCAKLVKQDANGEEAMIDRKSVV